MQLNRGLVRTHRLDRGGQVDGATIDSLANLGGGSGGNVSVGHGAEEAAVLTSGLGNLQSVSLEGIAQCVSFVERSNSALAASLSDLIDLLLATLGPRGSVATGDEVVAAVAVLDLNDFACLAEAGIK